LLQRHAAVLRIGEAAQLWVREAAGWQRIHTGRLHNTLQQQQQQQRQR
jgi:hypothetical protein